ncbi:MAG: methylated-DNA--[Desulfovibrio sp.]|nr:methylated-DNA--[protein]-cysteine S-methyltransferase [Desulfovibrio sp.]
MSRLCCDLPLVGLTLLEEEGGLLQAVRLYGKKAPPAAATGCTPCPGPLLQEAQAQLTAWLTGRLSVFDLPFALSGTPFQCSVWQALLTIPYGQTRSYKDVAHAVGRPGASRAVGLANNRNRLPIIIPCHRVIGADGSLVGYAAGLPIKAALLQLEQHHH